LQCVLQCVLQRIPLCCNVMFSKFLFQLLQCVAVCVAVCVAAYSIVLQCHVFQVSLSTVVVRCSVCCSVLHRVAVSSFPGFSFNCCSVL